MTPREARLSHGPGEGEDPGAEDGLDGRGDGLALGQAAGHLGLQKRGGGDEGS